MSNAGNQIHEGPKTYHGSCHCGAVKYTMELDLSQGVSQCNCSICTKVNQLGASGKPHQLVVLQGEDQCTTYRFGPVATRYFCKHCGIHVFSRGDLAELGGAYAGCVVNTLDDVELIGLQRTYWDGRHDNWHAGPRSEPWPIFV